MEVYGKQTYQNDEWPLVSTTDHLKQVDHDYANIEQQSAGDKNIDEGGSNWVILCHLRVFVGPYNDYIIWNTFLAGGHFRLGGIHCDYFSFNRIEQN